MEKLPIQKYISYMAQKKTGKSEKELANELCKKLKAAIEDEMNAQKEYRGLLDEFIMKTAGLAPITNPILDIRWDETKHQKILEDIYKNLCEEND